METPLIVDFEQGLMAGVMGSTHYLSTFDSSKLRLRISGQRSWFAMFPANHSALLRRG